MADIFAFREDKLGFRHQLGERTVLGRGPECDLIIFDRNASRRHAEIFLLDEKFYIADLGSTNGTLVNNQPINIQTHLEPYDTIKIGQELFIFEPGLLIITGQAPSAIIIENLYESTTGLESAPATKAAGEVAPEDVPALMALSHSLLQCADSGETTSAISKYLRDRFSISFMALLWPARPPVRRLVSLMTSHNEKRLLLGHTPFNRVVKNREVLLWPSCISELTFHDRNRHVTHLDQPSLIGPIIADQETAGLMYLESQNRKFNTRDLKAFAAMLTLISQAVADMAGIRVFTGNESLGDAPKNILGTNDAKLKIVFSTAAQAAASSRPIMIHGETGTGKSDLASYIHSVSPRKGGRLVSLNLTTLPPAEIEAALFGVAQTNNSEGRTGLVELADGGTLFLRHVEYLPPSAQKFLLIAMEEGLFFPVGARLGKAVDLRIISSTFTDLADRVKGGEFREDLYMRLNGLVISMPPLREIKGDLETFLFFFLNNAAKSMGVKFDGVDQGALECLRAYHWPGNLAELKMEAGLMALFTRNGRVVLEDLPVHLRLSNEAFMGQDQAVSPLIAEAERRQLTAAMSHCQGDLERVADLLSQRPEYIIQKMRALQVDPINYQISGGFQQLPKGPGQTAMPAD